MSNEYFTPSNAPGTGSALSSATMRAEFGAVSTGMDKLPALSGHAYELAHINSGGTGMGSLTGSVATSTGSLGLGYTPETGVKFRIQLTPGANGYFYGAYSQVNASGSYTGDRIGVAGVSDAAVGATVARSVGALGMVRFYGPGTTLSEAVGVQSSVSTSGTGTITTSYGFKLDVTPSGGTTMSNIRGYYAPDIANNNYTGFYSDISSGTGKYHANFQGAADNYLGTGYTGIGVAPVAGTRLALTHDTAALPAIMRLDNPNATADGSGLNGVKTTLRTYDGAASSTVAEFGGTGNAWAYRMYGPNAFFLNATRAGGISMAASNASGAIRFATGGDQTSNVRLTIDSSGHVGIATATPKTASFGWASNAKITHITGDGSDATGSYGAVTVSNNRPTPSASDLLGAYVFESMGSANGSSPTYKASILGYADGAGGGTGGYGGMLKFLTRADNNSSAPPVRMTIDSSGNILNISSGGLGYGTGSGGAVTQTTSRTTGVTLNKTNGAITLVSAAGSASWQSFTVTNSTVAATDTVIVSQKSGTDLNMLSVTAVAAGSFRISFATTGGTTVEQPVFNFAVIKAVAA